MKRMRTGLQAMVLSLFMVLAGAFYAFSGPFAPKVEVPSGKDATPLHLQTTEMKSLSLARMPLKCSIRGVDYYKIISRLPSFPPTL